MGWPSNPLSDIRPASGFPAERQATAGSNTTCMRFSARMCWPHMLKPATTSARLRADWACHATRSIAPFVTSRADKIAQDDDGPGESRVTFPYGGALYAKDLIHYHVQWERRRV